MRKLFIAIICICLILGAVVIFKLLILTGPKAERMRPPKTAALVETLELRAADETVLLKLTGIVTPAEQIRLQPRVSGEIIHTAPNFIDGGLLRRGEEILKIDPVDYELALVDASSRLENARFNYKTELGRQEVARHEWELLKSDNATELEKELALRKPQLAADKAALEAAEAALKKAQINLERTHIRAPFNALVTRRNVYVGSQAALQSELGMLVGTDVYWVTVSIAVDRLRWVDIPGSRARLISASGAARDGTVIKLLGDLEETGRMARLLVEVQDPLCIRPENSGQRPLLLGEYVQVEIEGKRLENVFKIPRLALRENSSVWIAAGGRLDIRKVAVIWRDLDQVIIRDSLKPGEQLIVSDLTAPMQEMDVTDGRDAAAGSPETKQVKPANKE
jgi:RND family efflux transporter MFP subunit